MNENVDIFIYSHIPFKPIVDNKVYKVLTHTKEPIDTQLEVYRDYEGDNIGDKNLMYNEYTGFYWIWKNYNIKDYVGLNHYRRYYNWLNNVPDINTIFKFSKIILNRPIELICPLDKQPMNNRSWYGWWHNIEDFDKLRTVFETKFPEYMDGFNKMEKSDHIYNSSMFIMPKELFLKYCEFIFSVLDEYIKLTGLNTTEKCIEHVSNNMKKYMKTYENNGYDLPYYTVEIQSRIIGYVAERAMNAFIMNGEDSLEKNAMIIDWIHVE